MREDQIEEEMLVVQGQQWLFAKKTQSNQCLKPSEQGTLNIRIFVMIRYTMPRVEMLCGIDITCVLHIKVF